MSADAIPANFPQSPAGDLEDQWRELRRGLVSVEKRLLTVEQAPVALHDLSESAMYFIFPHATTRITWGAAHSQTVDQIQRSLNSTNITTTPTTAPPGSSSDIAVVLATTGCGSPSDDAARDEHPSATPASHSSGWPTIQGLSTIVVSKPCMIRCGNYAPQRSSGATDLGSGSTDAPNGAERQHGSATAPPTSQTNNSSQNNSNTFPGGPRPARRLSAVPTLVDTACRYHTVFADPLVIVANAPLAFVGMRFSAHVQVIGPAPVCFIRCHFAARPIRTRCAELLTSPGVDAGPPVSLMSNAHRLRSSPKTSSVPRPGRADDTRRLLYLVSPRQDVRGRATAFTTASDPCPAPFRLSLPEKGHGRRGSATSERLDSPPPAFVSPLSSNKRAEPAGDAAATAASPAPTVTAVEHYHVSAIDVADASRVFLCQCEVAGGRGGTGLCARGTAVVFAKDCVFQGSTISWAAVELQDRAFVEMEFSTITGVLGCGVLVRGQASAVLQKTLVLRCGVAGIVALEEARVELNDTGVELTASGTNLALSGRSVCQAETCTFRALQPTVAQPLPAAPPTDLHSPLSAGGGPSGTERVPYSHYNQHSHVSGAGSAPVLAMRPKGTTPLAVLNALLRRGVTEAVECLPALVANAVHATTASGLAGAGVGCETAQASPLPTASPTTAPPLLTSTQSVIIADMASFDTVDSDFLCEQITEARAREMKENQERDMDSDTDSGISNDDDSDDDDLGPGVLSEEYHFPPLPLPSPVQVVEGLRRHYIAARHSLAAYVTIVRRHFTGANCNRYEPALFSRAMRATLAPCSAPSSNLTSAATSHGGAPVADASVGRAGLVTTPLRQPRAGEEDVSATSTDVQMATIEIGGTPTHMVSTFAGSYVETVETTSGARTAATSAATSVVSLATSVPVAPRAVKAKWYRAEDAAWCLPVSLLAFGAQPAVMPNTTCHLVLRDRAVLYVATSTIEVRHITLPLAAPSNTSISTPAESDVASNGTAASGAGRTGTCACVAVLMDYTPFYSYPRGLFKESDKIPVFSYLHPPRPKNSTPPATATAAAATDPAENVSGTSTSPSVPVSAHTGAQADTNRWCTVLAEANVLRYFGVVRTGSSPSADRPHMVGAAGRLGGGEGDSNASVASASGGSAIFVDPRVGCSWGLVTATPLTVVKNCPHAIPRSANEDVNVIRDVENLAEKNRAHWARTEVILDGSSGGSLRTGTHSASSTMLGELPAELQNARSVGNIFLCVNEPQLDILHGACHHVLTELDTYLELAQGVPMTLTYGAAPTNVADNVGLSVAAKPMKNLIHGAQSAQRLALVSPFSSSASSFTSVEQVSTMTTDRPPRATDAKPADDTPDSKVIPMASVIDPTALSTASSTPQQVIQPHTHAETSSLTNHTATAGASTANTTAVLGITTTSEGPVEAQRQPEVKSTAHEAQTGVPDKTDVGAGNQATHLLDRPHPPHRTPALDSARNATPEGYYMAFLEDPYTQSDMASLTPLSVLSSPSASRWERDCAGQLVPPNNTDVFQTQVPVTSRTVTQHSSAGRHQPSARVESSAAAAGDEGERPLEERQDNAKPSATGAISAPVHPIAGPGQSENPAVTLAIGSPRFQEVDSDLGRNHTVASGSHKSVSMQEVDFCHCSHSSSLPAAVTTTQGPAPHLPFNTCARQSSSPVELDVVDAVSQVNSSSAATESERPRSGGLTPKGVSPDDSVEPPVKRDEQLAPPSNASCILPHTDGAHVSRTNGAYATATGTLKAAGSTEDSPLNIPPTRSSSSDEAVPPNTPQGDASPTEALSKPEVHAGTGPFAPAAAAGTLSSEAAPQAELPGGRGPKNPAADSMAQTALHGAVPETTRDVSYHSGDTDAPWMTHSADAPSNPALLSDAAWCRSASDGAAENQATVPTPKDTTKGATESAAMPTEITKDHGGDKEKRDEVSATQSDENAVNQDQAQPLEASAGVSPEGTEDAPAEEAEESASVVSTHTKVFAGDWTTVVAHKPETLRKAFRLDVSEVCGLTPADVLECTFALGSLHASAVVRHSRTLSAVDIDARFAEYDFPLTSSLIPSARAPSSAQAPPNSTAAEVTPAVTRTLPPSTARRTQWSESDLSLSVEDESETKEEEEEEGPASVSAPPSSVDVQEEEEVADGRASVETAGSDVRDGDDSAHLGNPPVTDRTRVLEMTPPRDHKSDDTDADDRQPVAIEQADSILPKTELRASAVEEAFPAVADLAHQEHHHHRSHPGSGASDHRAQPLTALPQQHRQVFSDTPSAAPVEPRAVAHGVLEAAEDVEDEKGRDDSADDTSDYEYEEIEETEEEVEDTGTEEEGEEEDDKYGPSDSALPSPQEYDPSESRPTYVSPFGIAAAVPTVPPAAVAAPVVDDTHAVSDLRDVIRDLHQLFSAQQRTQEAMTSALLRHHENQHESAVAIAAAAAVAALEERERETRQRASLPSPPSYSSEIRRVKAAGAIADAAEAELRQEKDAAKAVTPQSSATPDGSEGTPATSSTSSAYSYSSSVSGDDSGSDGDHATDAHLQHRYNRPPHTHGAGSARQTPIKVTAHRNTRGEEFGRVAKRRLVRRSVKRHKSSRSQPHRTPTSRHRRHHHRRHEEKPASDDSSESSSTRASSLTSSSTSRRGRSAGSIPSSLADVTPIARAMDDVPTPVPNTTNGKRILSQQIHARSQRSTTDATPIAHVPSHPQQDAHPSRARRPSSSSVLRTTVDAARRASSSSLPSLPGLSTSAVGPAGVDPLLYEYEAEAAARSRQWSVRLIHQLLRANRDPQQYLAATAGTQATPQQESWMDPQAAASSPVPVLPLASSPLAPYRTSGPMTNHNTSVTTTTTTTRHRRRPARPRHARRASPAHAGGGDARLAPVHARPALVYPITGPELSSASAPVDLSVATRAPTPMTVFVHDAGHGPQLYAIETPPTGQSVRQPRRPSAPRRRPPAATNTRSLPPPQEQRLRYYVAPPVVSPSASQPPAHHRSRPASALVNAPHRHASMPEKPAMILPQRPSRPATAGGRPQPHTTTTSTTSRGRSHSRLHRQRPRGADLHDECLNDRYAREAWCSFWEHAAAETRAARRLSPHQQDRQVDRLYTQPMLASMRRELAREYLSQQECTFTPTINEMSRVDTRRSHSVKQKKKAKKASSSGAALRAHHAPKEEAATHTMTDPDSTEVGDVTPPSHDDSQHAEHNDHDGHGEV